MTFLSRLSYASLIVAGVPLWGCGSSESSAGSGGGRNGASAGAASSAAGSVSAGGSNPSGSAGSGVSNGQAGSGVAGAENGAGGRPSGSGGTSAAGASAAGASSAGASATGGSSTGAGGAGPTSSGCGSANTTSPCGAKGTTCSLSVSGTDRKYYVQLPKNYSASTPYRLVFQFHPWGGSADQALTMYGLNSGLADSIFVTPQGLDAGSNGAGWANTDGQDIAFTKAMLADVEGKYCVDTARIFSVGFSYGGMMSFALGCEMSNVFRAIAPMSGALYSDPSCKGTGPHVAMWGSHGTSDTVVPIENGRAARDKILAENHCGTTTTPVDPSPCVKYQGCDPGYDVTWCEWDGPHGIPSFGSKSITAFLKQF